MRERRDLAQAVWYTAFSELRKYGISSYREITGLDTIGIPVWICNRPLAKTISVTAGKNPDPMLAAAASIIEAVEFWASEKPSSKFLISSYRDLVRNSSTIGDILPLRDYPLAKDNLLDEDVPIGWELVEKLIESSKPLLWMPCNMVWLQDRVQQQFLDVQQSSNGLASGVTKADAILQGLYELVERDGWTIGYQIRESLGVAAERIPLVGLPAELEWLIQMITKAGLHPFVFNCTRPDLGIPVVGCALFGEDGVGLFGGYGAHLSARVAASRAIIEAVQSRVCYISGARDDLYRRDFILMKRSASEKLWRQAQTIKPVNPTWDEFASGPMGGLELTGFSDIEQELHFLVSMLERAGIDRLYYQELAKERFSNRDLHVVKVIAPQLEGPICDHWKTTGRAAKALEEYFYPNANVESAG